MAVQNLTRDEREEMIKYMKQAMEGTFFDRWLLMSGWMQSSSTKTSNAAGHGGQATSSTSTGTTAVALPEAPASMQQGDPSVDSRKRRAPDSSGSVGNDKRPNRGDGMASVPVPIAPGNCLAGANITGQAELERLIRAVASNPGLTPVQKNTTIQGLRDSVWKSNQKQRENSEQQTHSFAPQTSVMTR